MANTVKDLICGMMIDPATAAGNSEYSGQTYYFCGLGCKKEFDADPAKYVDAESSPASHDHDHGHHH